MGLRILGTGSALPALVKTNDDLSTFLDTSDEWISTRTGIRERHWMNGETVDGLAIEAVGRALENAGVKAEELDYIICATLGGEWITPPTACLVQAGISARCPAVDLNGACSGFIYALDMAAGKLATGCKKVLVVAAEGLTRVADWTDRSTCVLFGDGAGAVVLGEGGDMPYLHLTSKGVVDILNIPFVSGNMPEDQTPERQKRPDPFLYMDGGEVYKFAVTSITRGVKAAMNAAGIGPEDVDHVLLHQANLRIIDAAKKKLGIPEERYHTNIERVGNMSAASIPVLLDECNQKGLFKEGDTLVMSAFGGGLTTGTALIRW